MVRQQFHRGDLVFLRAEYWHDPELGGYSSDPEDKTRERHPAEHAIIVGSYRDQYGGGEGMRHTYTILVLDKEGQPLWQSSWHDDARIEYLVQERCIETLDILDFDEERDEEEEEEL
jgi:hypothetical protein